MDNTLVILGLFGVILAISCGQASSGAQNSVNALNDSENNTGSNMTTTELASLAGKCLKVVRSELTNRDIPVAFAFLGITEKVISAIGGNTTETSNQSLIIQPGMCDWYDPESKADIK